VDAAWRTIWIVDAYGKLKRVLIGTSVAGLQYGQQNAIVTRLATQRPAAVHMML